MITNDWRLVCSYVLIEGKVLLMFFVVQSVWRRSGGEIIGRVFVVVRGLGGNGCV